MHLILSIYNQKNIYPIVTLIWFLDRSPQLWLRFRPRVWKILSDNARWD